MGLLNMSVTGGVVILAVIVVRALAVNRLPKGAFTALWTVALLRLFLPVSVPSASSIYGLLAVPAPASAAVQMAEPTPAPAPAGHDDIYPARAAAPAADTVTQEQSQARPARRADTPWRTAVWAAGAAACAGYFALGYGLARRRFREAVAVEDDFVSRWQAEQPLRRRVSVRLSGRVKAPMTYGLVCPVVLLPAATDWRDQGRLKLILAHEYAHIRRLDGLRKLLLTAAVCLHWFNPLVWAMFFLANRDMEMACDEQVVRAMDGDGRADYARVLIDMEQARGLTPLVSYFAANAMEERITAIMKMKKLTALAVVISVLLTLGVTAVFATDAKPAEGSETDGQTERTAYDWGEARVLLPLTEAGLEALFPEDDIQWWTAAEFAAWAKAQEPLLDAAEGTEANSASYDGGVWTQERSQMLTDAWEDMAAALEGGAKLSRTVNGDGRVVLAVGMDWDLSQGDGEMAYAYDVGALVWGAPATGLLSGVTVEAGGWQVLFAGSQTYLGELETMRAFLDNRVAAGAVTQETANAELESCWSVFQSTEMPSRWRVSAAPASPTPSPAPVAAPPTPLPTPTPKKVVMAPSTPSPIPVPPLPTPAPGDVDMASPTPSPAPAPG